MARLGYGRCSSVDQSLDIQIADLKAYGCETIRSEKVSGRTTANRPELELLLQFVREGDELVVCRLDRLARSTLDLCRIVRLLEERKAVLKVLHQPVETKTSVGRLLVHMLGVIAEFENDLRRERQSAGIAAAKASGKYRRGRPTTGLEGAVTTFLDAGVPIHQVVRKTGASRSTVYRIRKAADDARSVLVDVPSRGIAAE